EPATTTPPPDPGNIHSTRRETSIDGHDLRCTVPTGSEDHLNRRRRNILHRRISETIHTRHRNSSEIATSRITAPQKHVAVRPRQADTRPIRITHLDIQVHRPRRRSRRQLSHRRQLHTATTRKRVPATQQRVRRIHVSDRYTPLRAIPVREPALIHAVRLSHNPAPRPHRPLRGHVQHHVVDAKRCGLPPAVPKNVVCDRGGRHPHITAKRRFRNTRMIRSHRIPRNRPIQRLVPIRELHLHLTARRTTRRRHHQPA